MLLIGISGSGALCTSKVQYSFEFHWLGLGLEDPSVYQNTSGHILQQYFAKVNLDPS